MSVAVAVAPKQGAFTRAREAGSAFTRRVAGIFKPRESVVRLIRWFAGLSLIGAILVAGSFALKGLGLALIVVAAMLLTIELVPGFHWVATSKVGMPIVIIATAWLTTHLVSIGTIVGAFALSFALIIKVFIVRGMRMMELNERAALAAA